MFLDKFNEYQNKCKELSIINAKNCKICNGLGTIPNPNGTHNRCKCQTNAMIIARQICNGEPERFLKLYQKATKNTSLSAGASYILQAF